jgi:nucleoside-diphosphate-sugar epimerase
VADCAISAALHPAAVGQAYNAAPPTRIGVRAFLGELCRALDIPPPRGATPYLLAACAAHAAEAWARISRRRTAPAISRAGLAILTQDVRHDPAKAKRDLGWQAKVELADGVRQTAAWLRERHPELCRPG